MRFVGLAVLMVGWLWVALTSLVLYAIYRRVTKSELSLG